MESEKPKDNKPARRRHPTSSTQIWLVFAKEPPEKVSDWDEAHGFVEKFPDRSVAYNAATVIAKRGGGGCAWIVHWDNDDTNTTIEEVRYGVASYRGMTKEPLHPK